MPQNPRKKGPKRSAKSASAAKKAAWGGRRAGAGRPPANPEGEGVIVAVSIPVALVTKLDALATARDWNRSQAVTEAIRRLVKSAARRG